MNNRPKNYADPKYEGDYFVHVKDNKVTISKYDNVVRAVGIGEKQEIVKCHPDDEFDIATAIDLGIKRVNMDNTLHVGDVVQVIDEGASYCTMRQWPSEFRNVAHRYRYGVCPTKGMKAKVIGTYEMYKGNTVYIISAIDRENMVAESSHYNKLTVADGVYVVGRQGLKKIKDWSLT